MAVTALTHEEIVQRIIDILDAELPGKINELNDKLGGTPLPHPEKIFFGERQIDTLINLNKNVGSVISDREDTNLSEGGYNEEDWYFSIALILRAEAPRFQKVMEKWAMRMKDAIREVIDEHPLLDFKGTTVKDMERSGTSVTPLELRGDQFFKAVVQELRIRVIVCGQNAW